MPKRTRAGIRRVPPWAFALALAILGPSTAHATIIIGGNGVTTVEQAPSLGGRDCACGTGLLGSPVQEQPRIGWPPSLRERTAPSGVRQRTARMGQADEPEPLFAAEEERISSAEAQETPAFAAAETPAETPERSMGSLIETLPTPPANDEGSSPAEPTRAAKRAASLSEPEPEAVAPEPEPEPAPEPERIARKPAPKRDAERVATLTPPDAPVETRATRSALSLAFAGGSDALSDQAAAALAQFAGRFAKTTDRIEIVAYATAAGEDTGAARRLSLKRALAVRNVLLNQGIRSTRIDVRALGGSQAGGEPDRVDLVVERAPVSEPASDGP